jgi:hypothetical protein
MRRPFAPFAAALLAVGLLAPPAAAQFANADLAGTVTGEDAVPVAGVAVTATHDATRLARTTRTAANGGYAINGLQPGLYTVSFAKEGFKTVEQSGIELRVGQEARLNVRLDLETVAETISVTGRAALVETTSKEVGGTFTAAEFEALPTQSRSALLFAALLPGVVGSPSTESTASDALFVNGQDDNNNTFNVDGVNNDDDVIGARAGAQARTPIEAIQEFQVLTTQFDAEFGRSVGGVLNAVTKSGGNEFHGSAFAFSQDSGLNEPNFFTERNDLEQPDSQYRSLGFTAGGPIVRGKAFFFASYEDNLNEEGITGAFSTRPELNFTTTENNDISNYLGRIDYRPVDNHHVVARYLLEESPQFNQVIGNVTLEGAREEDDTDSNWIVSLDSVFGARAFNAARLSFTKEDVAFANPGFNGNGQSFEAQRNLAASEAHPTFTGGASTVAQARVNRSSQLDDTFSYFLPGGHGEHELRAGFQYSEREEEFSDFGFSNGQFFIFGTDQPFDAGDITTYPGAFAIRVLGGLSAEIPDNSTLGVFVQDDWRINERLTLNLGVRYDEEDVTDDENFAPRLGFAWDPLGEGRTVVRGGYGRFYSRFEMGFFQNFFLDAADLPQGFILRVPDAAANQQLFFDLAQANGITTLDQLRDLLVSLFEGGAVAPLNTQPTVDSPNRRQPYLDSISLGAEHELWPGISASVDLVHGENRDVLLLADLNPFSAAAGGRPNISILDGEQVAMGSVLTWVNGGENDYDAVQLALRKRYTGRWGGQISLTLAQSEGNNFGGGAGSADAYFQRATQTGYNFDTGEIIGQPLDLGLDDPRARDVPVNWHRDVNLVLSAQYRVPGTSWREGGGLVVSGIYRYLTGEPQTLFENTLRLDNGNRAPLPAGGYDATQPSGIAENGTRFDGKLGGAEEPDFSRLDLSFRYDVPIVRGIQGQLVADVFNVFDEVNYDGFGGNVFGQGPFLTPQTAFNPREFQLGVRIEF